MYQIPIIESRLEEASKTSASKTLCDFREGRDSWGPGGWKRFIRRGGAWRASGRQRGAGRARGGPRQRGSLRTGTEEAVE